MQLNDTSETTTRTGSTAMPNPGAIASSESPSANDDNILLRGSKAFVQGAQSFLYSRFLDVHTFGAEHVPQEGGFFVAANHASHLDAGLVKAALGDRGQELWALAAQDYFFSHPLRRWYFENFTRVMPIPRGGNFKAAMKRAVATVRGGEPILIFPEGTRSVDGSIASFKPAISSMALMADRPILPMYLWGTHEALPKGSLLVPVARRMGAVIGPAISAEALREATSSLPKNQATRVVTQCVELAVRALQQGRPISPQSVYATARRLSDAEAAAGDTDATFVPSGHPLGRGVRGIA